MSKKIRLIKKRRICRLHGCENILSIYNLEPYCHTHHHIGLAVKSSSQELLKR